MTNPLKDASTSAVDPEGIAWSKADGLIPAIVQDAASGVVLMLGYMNREALDATQRSGLVTFFSRTRQALWQKGETSGRSLQLREIRVDCDKDTLLVLADPKGPTCHLGTQSCFGAGLQRTSDWLSELETVVRQRASILPAESYTAQLLRAGIKRIAQKVGEEGVEVALAATAGTMDEARNEIADLVYHLTVLLRVLDLDWPAIGATLAERRHSRLQSRN